MAGVVFQLGSLEFWYRLLLGLLLKLLGLFLAQTVQPFLGFEGRLTMYGLGRSIALFFVLLADVRRVEVPN